MLKRLVQWNIIVMSVLHLNTQAKPKPILEYHLKKWSQAPPSQNAPNTNYQNKYFVLMKMYLICHQCRDEDHKPPHKTKLVVDCEKDIKNELKASVAVLTDLKELEKEEMI
jgi:hypothetical protein